MCHSVYLTDYSIENTNFNRMVPLIQEIVNLRPRISNSDDHDEKMLPI